MKIWVHGIGRRSFPKADIEAVGFHGNLKKCEATGCETIERSKDPTKEAKRGNIPKNEGETETTCFE